jgi:phosphate/phosphite/phosphonate ABC transporter binding protein
MPSDTQLDFVTFGHASPHASAQLALLAEELGRAASIDVNVTAVDSYRALAALLHDGKIDIAWLGPVPFLSLATQSLAVPLASVREAPYRSAIIVRADSTLREPKSLEGKRAAWVDRHSAAGFIVPSIQLASVGLNPRRAFAEEKFFGTHAAVAKAVVDGDADFGATYAWEAMDGTVRGPWTSEPVRVLTTFGEIPPDVIAARASLSESTREAIASGMRRITALPFVKKIVLDVFGSPGFSSFDAKLYDRLRAAALAAHRRGLLDVDDDTAKTLEIAPVM